MSDVQELANMIYGEAADQDESVMKMVGSTAINRMNSGRTQEFGETLPDIVRRGYYAVSKANTPYKEAASGKFASEEGEYKYKKALAIAGGLLRETIKPDEGMFYFKKDEIARMKKAKSFNFKLVKPVGKTGDYEVFSY